MKSPLLTCMALLVIATSVHGQFSLLPQIGFEQSRVTLGYNSLATSGVEGNLRASLKADYRFKNGLGPFINLATSPAPVRFTFSNDGVLDKNFQNSANKLQFRMEAGYQYASKPIRLGKKATSPKLKEAATSSYSTMQRKSCGANTYRSHCGDKKATPKQAPVDKSLNMRLHPSLALAYLSAQNATIRRQGNGFEYNATSWNTAIVPAMGVEFGKGTSRLFTLTVFYTKPMDMRTESVSSMSGSKPVTTTLNPKAATWGMTFGVPISLYKTASKKPEIKKPQVYQETKTYQYKKCNKTIRL